MLNYFTLCLCVGVSFVVALDPFDNFREGPCATRVTPVTASREFVDSLKYISAGNRYQIYRTASPLPNYSTLTEYQLISQACYNRNMSTTNTDNPAAVFGFGGRVLSNAQITTRDGIYFEVPGNLRAVITHTDYKSFAVSLACWIKDNVKAWTVLTLRPTISPRARRSIEEHAISLGFQQKNFVFLNYDRCKREIPFTSCPYRKGC